jgi:AbrB family looped-hinge helix DNA binding protein
VSPLEVVVREKGRIVLPAEVREALGLRKGDKLELSVENGVVILRPKGAVRLSELKGIIGPAKVSLEDVEEALGRV